MKINKTIWIFLMTIPFAFSSRVLGQVDTHREFLIADSVSLRFKLHAKSLGSINSQFNKKFEALQTPFANYMFKKGNVNGCNGIKIGTQNKGHSLKKNIIIVNGNITNFATSKNCEK